MLPPVIWICGLSGAGKSTMANGLVAELKRRKLPVVLLDGDAVRAGLSHDLGFSEADRSENIRRIAEMARLLTAQGIHVIVAAITPRNSMRTTARTILGRQFHLVFADAPVATCRNRDRKTIYAGKKVSGVQQLFDRPRKPDLHVRTYTMDKQAEIKMIIAWWKKRIAHY